MATAGVDEKEAQIAFHASDKIGLRIPAYRARGGFSVIAKITYIPGVPNTSSKGPKIERHARGGQIKVLNIQSK